MEMPNSQAGCGNVLGHYLKISLETPEFPPEPFQEMARPETAPERPPQDPPAYEHHIESIVYAIGHGLCLMASMGVLWLLLQAPIEPRRLITAFVVWLLLGFVCYKAILGVRYGSSIRLYKDYLELANLAPLKVITRGEVAYFRE